MCWLVKELFEVCFQLSLMFRTSRLLSCSIEEMEITELGKNQRDPLCSTAFGNGWRQLLVAIVDIGM